jgi:hypothetical protein
VLLDQEAKKPEMVARKWPRLQREKTGKLVTSAS